MYLKVCSGLQSDHAVLPQIFNLMLVYVAFQLCIPFVIWYYSRDKIHKMHSAQSMQLILNFITASPQMNHSIYFNQLQPNNSSDIRIQGFENETIVSIQSPTKIYFRQFVTAKYVTTKSFSIDLMIMRFPQCFDNVFLVLKI